MTKKWRESLINPNEIKFNTDLKISSIVSYPPAGNDVFECIGNFNSKNIHFFLKVSRGTFSNILNEADILIKLKHNNIKVPEVLDYGNYKGYDYIVTKKKYGSKLSNLIKRGHNSIEYMYNYGFLLAKIHSLSIETQKAKQRKINDIVEIDINKYKELEKFYNYLIKNKIERDYDTFIHGDFHYGKLLFKNNNISCILDFEYSGFGFKEQDIAWAIALRPTGNFLKTKKEINEFLKGYKSIGNFDYNKFLWCYVNASLHFYKMNSNNAQYKKRLLKLLESIMEDIYE